MTKNPAIWAALNPYPNEFEAVFPGQNLKGALYQINADPTRDFMALYWEIYGRTVPTNIITCCIIYHLYTLFLISGYWPVTCCLIIKYSYRIRNGE
jgi:hypothetical protein